MTTATLAMADETAPKTRTLELQTLYQEHSRAVYLTALRVTGNPADAEDVLQTVFMRMSDTTVALDAARSPGAYLRRSAANAAIDLLRRRKSRRETGIQDVTARHDTFVLKQRLRAALSRLSPENAELFILCYVEGYSYDELAEMLDLERGTVASRLHRIRATLQNELNR